MMVSAKDGSNLYLVMCLLITAVLFMFFSQPIARAADDQSNRGDGIKVMEVFEHQSNQNRIDRPFTIQKKHMTMFFLGVPLLIMLLITGGLGIAMGIYGKQVFVQHMISAGLTITLAFVHAILGVVWFYPF